MTRKIAFIINPTAGTKNKNLIRELIHENMPNHIQYEIMIWNEKNGFSDLWKEIIDKKFETVVAVGGDGTVNEVAKHTAGTGIKLGIIPTGSGNGLARSLGISMKTDRAVQTILKNSVTTIDGGSINNTKFFCTSGVGFDAHIGSMFAKNKRRGLFGYIKITLQELVAYKPQNYRIEVNGKIINRDAFLITFANAGQYGNDFYIAPQAKTNDGKLHMVILKPFPLLLSPFIIWKIDRKNAHKSRFIETFVTDKILLRRNEGGAVHFDGEPTEEGYDIEVKIKKAELKIIYES
jgi:YegS/Rv2252/BmrU family lipid kinase